MESRSDGLTANGEKAAIREKEELLARRTRRRRDNDCGMRPTRLSRLQSRTRTTTTRRIALSIERGSSANHQPGR
jgi:hypothetical protein